MILKKVNAADVDIYGCAMRKQKHTDAQFISIVRSSFSIREVLQKLELAMAGGSYKTFYSKIKSLNLDITHFNGQAHLKGKSHNWSTKIPLADILIKNSNFSNSNHLKHRLIKENILINKCSDCSIISWQGKELSLHLDHIDGDNTNNEISNLRLLCPNCHSLTPTYCGRNKKKK